MTYLTRSELVDMFERGEMEIVAKQVLLYGWIKEERSWFGAPAKETRGEHRMLDIQHHDMIWKIGTHNKIVTSVGYVVESEV